MTAPTRTSSTEQMFRIPGGSRGTVRLPIVIMGVAAGLAAFSR